MVKINNNKHYIIIIPTIMDDALAIRVFTKFWYLIGFTPIVLKFGWRNINDESDFTQSINRIITEVDQFSKSGTVSLVGCSAGGNIAINVFSKRTHIARRVINVCGALKSTGISSKFDTQTYVNSLKLCEKTLLEMDGEKKKRIMTIHPRFGDEFVKKETVITDGARNVTVPTYEHMFSIFMSLTLFSKKIFKFLKED